MTTHTGGHHVLNIINRIGHTCIFGQRAISVIGFAGLLIQNNVFTDRTETHRIIDLRLMFPGEVDTLGITAALEIEDTIISPTMLIITDQAPIWVSGKARLAGTRKAKEESDITLRTDVRRTVHGQYTLSRQDKIEHR